MSKKQYTVETNHGLLRTHVWAESQEEANKMVPESSEAKEVCPFCGHGVFSIVRDVSSSRVCAKCQRMWPSPDWNPKLETPSELINFRLFKELVEQYEVLKRENEKLKGQQVTYDRMLSTNVCVPTVEYAQFRNDVRGLLVALNSCANGWADPRIATDALAEFYEKHPGLKGTK